METHELTGDSYTVIWTTSALGLSFSRHISGMPVVRAIRDGDPMVTSQVAIGDALAEAGGLDTAGVGFETALQSLGHLRKPISLTFVRAAPDEYTVHWVSDARLGINFVKGRNGLPIVTKVTPDAGHPGLDRVRVGDVLVMVNDERTEDILYRQTIFLMQIIEKPCILTFQSPRLNASQRINNDSFLSPTTSQPQTSRTSDPPMPSSMAYRAHPIASYPQYQPRRAPSVFTEGEVDIDDDGMGTVVDFDAEFQIEDSDSNRGSVIGNVFLNSNGLHSNSLQPNGLHEASEATSNGNSSGVNSSAGGDSYRLIWGEGPLNVEFEELPGGRSMVVKAVYDSSELFAIGDYLVKINDRRVADIGAEEAWRLLSELNRPIILDFKPAHSAEQSIAVEERDNTRSFFQADSPCDYEL